MARIRYIVDDVDAAVTFYRSNLGFEVVMHPAPTFAMLERGDLRLLLNAPGAGGGGAGEPSPGGWNRFQVEVDDLDETMSELVGSGVEVRVPVTQGNGGRQAVVQDPAGNPVELFEPARP